MPYWTKGDLFDHHRRHPGSAEEHDCWCGIVGTGGVQVTVAQYEHVSMAVVQNPDFSYLCEYRRGEYAPWEPRHNFVDPREVLTATELNGRIRSCFHIHYRRSTCMGPRKAPRGERWQALEDRLKRRERDGRERSIKWEKK